MALEDDMVKTITKLFEVLLCDGDGDGDASPPASGLAVLVQVVDPKFQRNLQIYRISRCLTEA